ncbi:MAG: hypothetical protein ACYTBP_09510 [Planctomycetota bacterium]
MKIKLVILIFLPMITSTVIALETGLTVHERAKSTWVWLDETGRLVYGKDEKGNQIPDFSNVGYHAGEKAIPDVSVKKTLTPSQGQTDDTERIQNALNEMALLPLNPNGICGALLLRKGVYKVKETLTISHSGIVLRGDGNGPDGTIIIATGYGDEKLQRTLISVGSTEGPSLNPASKRTIKDKYVPIGSKTFTIESSKGYSVGDRILVFRPATAKWIHVIGTDRIPSRWGKTEDGRPIDLTKQWKPEDFDFYFERTITALQGNRVTIDAPVPNSLDKEFGGGAIFHYTTPNRIFEVGIENLRLLSQFGEPTSGNICGDPEKDGVAEGHAWHAIILNRNTENTWVRDITSNYFGWSCVYAKGRNATIQDCLNQGHASRVTGGRRYPFAVKGQLNLFKRCYAVSGRHEFDAHSRAAGPNVFVDCRGYRSLAASGPHLRYAIATLFDNVHSENYMESRWRGKSGTGHGWAGTQTVFYNCIAPLFNVSAPPGGISWVIGSGTEEQADQNRIQPRSLYYHQLRERLGNIKFERLYGKEPIE